MPTPPALLVSVLCALSAGSATPAVRRPLRASIYYPCFLRDPEKTAARAVTLWAVGGPLSVCKLQMENRIWVMQNLGLFHM